ncbi:MAG: ABC transporter, ATP-binding protein, MsbA family [Parcubacteria group bacterium GW2011_GWA2_43_9b]|uniref:ABC transporter ATP-binding protein n=1 Tax=Candidatus Portnoybacteria bacterium RIFCSPLOWO2_02_FULL_39_11 TaxID=1802001 RepID=A0A1G2FPN2_9BACT|nr:MAG: ABC transporter, ATP-binding protein, MsbA family [Parcubacteria group bacterium GW2011_GWA2_43_9b]OGZ39578.1 MAG: hypothetical protein A3B04_00745 [Candidatus Portnoybacteria bacterium RIFCSPLOWO2_02_FULL_39_11]
MIFKKNKLNELAGFFYRAYWGYKKQILILTALGFLSSLLEGVGINAAIPMFSFIAGGGVKSEDAITKAIQNFFNFFHINFSLKYLFIFVCLLLLLRVLVLLISNYIKIKITATYEEKTRGNLFKMTAQARWPYLLKQKLGHLDTILMTNVAQGGILLQSISDSFMIAASLIIFLLVAINISWKITLITMILGGSIFIFFRNFLYQTRAFSREQEKVNRQTAHLINENIMGMKTVKTMSVGAMIIVKAEEYFAALKKLKIKTAFFRIFTDALIQPIGLFFVFVIFAVSYKTKAFNIAVLAAIVYLIQRIFIYTQQLQNIIYSMANTAPYVNKMLEYQNEAAGNKESDNGNVNFKFCDSLEFKNVGFGYDARKPILSNLNFNVQKGEMVGLIGPSGAGKTTVVDMILRLLDPSAGKILLDGLDVKEIKMSEWRKNIGYVSQDIFLKNDTITNNIKFYDDSITETAMERAAAMANIHDFIQSCPNKYQTVIGERGLLISVGQRQRIVIARILARQPQILILDEATSALDNESETQIQKVIENLKNQITVLVIAHRLSTIVNSDRLLVLDGGKIIEEGAPQMLLNDENSYFYKVYNIKNN